MSVILGTALSPASILPQETSPAWAENLLILRDKKLTSLYIRNWQEHFKHSEVYDGRGRQSRNTGTIH